MLTQSYNDGDRAVVRIEGDHLLINADSRLRLRLSEIGYTSAERGFWGLKRVGLHDPGGRVLASLASFPQIDAFYTDLLAELGGRPHFDGVREQLPSDLDALEKVIWAAAQEGADGQPWEALQAEGAAIAVATSAGFLLAPPESDQIERISWTDLAGVRWRPASSFWSEPVTRFFRVASYVDLPFSGLEEAVVRAWQRHWEDMESAGASAADFTIVGVECVDDDVAMTYCWEIERAVSEGIIDAGEVIVACAFGRGHVNFLEGVANVPEGLSVFGKWGMALGVGKAIHESVVRTEWLLTNRRLLQVDRSPVCAVPKVVPIHLDDLPRLRRGGVSLIFDKCELQTDARQPGEMAKEFEERHSWLMEQPWEGSEAGAKAAPPTEGDSSQSVSERLRAIRALWQDGILTEDEYQAKRQELIQLL